MGFVWVCMGGGGWHEFAMSFVWVCLWIGMGLLLVLYGFALGLLEVAMSVVWVWYGFAMGFVWVCLGFGMSLP